MQQPELYTDKSIYRKPFPRFERPNIVGYIELPNLKFIKNVKNVSVQYDLNLHIDKARRKPEDNDVKLTELLKFLLHNERRLKLIPNMTMKDAKIYCYRGLMTCVACTPYENREPWKIVAILFKGNIYLCARDTEVKINRIKNMTETEKRFTSWGYKFEQYMTSDHPNGEPNPHVPVDETEEFSLVFTTQLNSHTIMYGAEMDGIRCDKAKISVPPDEEMGPQAVIEYLRSKEFIELKTNRHIEFSKQENSFRRFKTKKWWCQSFLVGIDTIVCGFRDDNGIVEKLKLFSVRDLPKISQTFWDPNVCFNFLDTFFTYVKRCLGRKVRHLYGDQCENNLDKLPLVSLLFEWTPNMPVYVAEHYVHDDDPILPQWYTDRRN